VDGRRLGSRYVLTQRFGRGATGEVFRARVESGADGTPQADVAVKVLRQDLTTEPDGVSRFLQEGRLLRSVVHPNVVRVHDLVVEGDRFALVMDLVDGGDLRRAVPIPCTEAQAARIVAGAAAGLGAVHAAGILHRDLKPENILVEHLDDGTALARIGDFGVSRFVSTASTRTLGLTGTAGYIAPELARGGRAVPAGDVYSLGVVLYELCAGQAPFTAEHPLALVRAHADDPVPRPDGMSDGMWSLLSELLSKDPDERPTAAELADRLDLLAAALEPEAASLAPGTFVAGAAATRPIAEVLDTEVPATGVPYGDVPGGRVPDGEVAAPAVTADGAAPALLRHERRGPVTYLVTAAAVVVVLVGAWLALAPRIASGDPGVVALGDTAEPVAGTGPSGTGSGRAPVTATSPAIGTGSASPTVRRTVARAGRTSAPSSQVTATRTDGSITTVTVPAPGAGVDTRPAAPADPTTGPSAPADPRAGSVPLYRYFSAGSGDHFYTTNRNDLGDGKSGYVFEGAKAYVYPAAREGTVPLYRYFSAGSGDHFYTTDWNDLGNGKSGYVFERVEAYVYPAKREGTVPLYRYFSAGSGDHFYTTNWNDLGNSKSGYVFERIAGYVVP